MTQGKRIFKYTGAKYLAGLTIRPAHAPGGGSGDEPWDLEEPIVAKNVIENRRDRKKDRKEGDEKDEKTEEKK